MSFALFAAFGPGRRVSEIILASGELPAVVITCATDPDEAALAAQWREAGVPVLQRYGVNSEELRVELQRVAPTMCILVWWPEIVRAPALGVPRDGWVNMHPSLLPWGKGKHGYYWSIVNNEPFGVSLHLIDAGIDTGRILFQRELAVDWTDTGESLYARSMEAIIDLFRESWPRISRGDWNASTQPDNAGSFHWGKEIAAHSQIDLDQHYTGRELLNLLRARTFWSGDSAWFEDNGQRYRVKLKIERAD